MQDVACKDQQVTRRLKFKAVSKSQREALVGFTELNCRKHRETTQNTEGRWASLHLRASFHVHSIFLALSASFLISVSSQFFHMPFQFTRSQSFDIDSVSQCLNSRHHRQRICWANCGQVPTPGPIIRWTLEDRVHKKRLGVEHL